MMKTALSIIQSLRYRMNLPAPTTLISVTDPDELQMIHLLYAVCEELRQARCWPQLKRTYTFNTVASQQSYQLPPDFYAPLLRTHWNDDEDQRLEGPVSDDHFQYLLQSGSSSNINYTFRIFGADENSASSSGQLWLNPTPSAVDAIDFEYLTRSFFLPANWVAGTAYTVTTSFVNASGNIYQCSGSITESDTCPSGTSTSIDDDDGTWDFYSAAYETIVADTDLVVFDDDLVKLGLRAKWMEEKGGDFQAAKKEFESKINQAVARYRGSFVGSFSRRRRSGPLITIPYKSWSI